MPTTRLFYDAHDEQAWRKMGFYSVLDNQGSQAALMVAMLGIGLGWASLMGCPYIMLANSIPPERTGVYMGIFNMFIVLPMLVETLVLYFAFHPLLGGDARNVLMLAGVLMLGAAGATLAVGRTGGRGAIA